MPKHVQDDGGTKAGKQDSDISPVGCDDPAYFQQPTCTASLVCRFVSGGAQGLADELALDVRRLWLRNLGRDDRLVADWGREARHPFLDEAFMATLLDTPLSYIADLTLPPGRCAHAHLLLISALGFLPGCHLLPAECTQITSLPTYMMHDPNC